MMNSYFEQGGFYGQAAAATGTEQAYRFPLGLAGMAGVPSPYAAAPTTASAAAAAAAQPPPHQSSRAPPPPVQDGGGGGTGGAPSPYDSHNNTSPKSSSLYSSNINDTYKSTATTGGGTTPTGANGSSSSGGGGGGTVTPTGTGTGPADCKDQNGYSSLSKELAAAGGGGGGSWGSSSSSGGGSNPVRPSVCTPDPMARYAASPASSAAAVAAADAAAARDRWMNCTGLSSQQPQLQQSANHTFYPWMAIAGERYGDAAINPRAPCHVSVPLPCPHHNTVAVLADFSPFDSCYELLSLSSFLSVRPSLCCNVRVVLLSAPFPLLSSQHAPNCCCCCCNEHTIATLQSLKARAHLASPLSPMQASVEEN